MLQGLVVFAISLGVSWFCTWGLIRLLRKMRLLDMPNSRSSHVVPTPRGGGIGILGGLVAGSVSAWLLGVNPFVPQVFLAAAIIAFIGFADDRWGGFSTLLRLTAQLGAAGLVVYWQGGLDRLPLPPPLDVKLGYLGVPVALIWIVGVTNVYNFLDGIDGFAALQGVVVGLGLALLGQSPVLTALGLAVAGACAGFLPHNWHPAKVFMGDVGSGTIGFLAAALPFQLDPQLRSTTVFAVAICLWFFLSDGAFTILLRLLRGEKIWIAHCSHLYQRLVRTGLTHDQVAIRFGLLAGSLTALLLLAVRLPGSAALWVVLAVATVAFFFYSRWTAGREGLPLVTSTADSNAPHRVGTSLS